MSLKNNKKSLLALFAAVLLGLSACAGSSDNTITASRQRNADGFSLYRYPCELPIP